MFSQRRDAASWRKPGPRPDTDQDWQRLLAWLPAELDVCARKTGALVRRRIVTSGAMLLRLVLIYAVVCLSLRDAAAWAARALNVKLTGDALGYRFARATPLLQDLVRKLLQEHTNAPTTAGIALRLIDATVLTEPGSAGTDWRLHLTYAPEASEIVGVELTDAHGGEHLSRASCGAGDMVIGDRAYGHASDMREAKARRLQCLLRVHLQNLAVADAQGRRLDPASLLDEADAGQHDREVELPEGGYEPVGGRLVVVPLPPEQAARTRQRLRQQAQKKGKHPSELTLRLAGYFCCVTTLTSAQASVQALLLWYRIRWQVELLIKRGKSLLRLGQLTKASPALIAVQVWARLLVAILVERMASGTRSAAPFKPDALAPSPWRLTRIHRLDVVLAVYGGTSLEDRLAAAEVTAARLRERPRRRRPWPSQLSAVAPVGPSPP